MSLHNQIGVDVASFAKTWGPFIVGVLTLLAIVFFNRKSTRRLRESTNHLEDQVDSLDNTNQQLEETTDHMEDSVEHLKEQADYLNELTTRVLTPSVECELIEASSDKITFRVRNTSGVEFVMRAVCYVNEEPLKAKYWNRKDVHRFLSDGDITDNQLVKFEPARLYAELPLALSPEPGGPWATLIRPGETRHFSTDPFGAQRTAGLKEKREMERLINHNDYSVEDFEQEIGMEMNGMTRFPNLMDHNYFDKIEQIKFEPINPHGVKPSYFDL